jgi:ATP phosphoribosyltransferase
MGTLATLGAAAAGTILGVSAMLLMQNQDKKQMEKEKLEKLKERKRRYIEKKMLKDFLMDAKQNAIALEENSSTTKKPKRRVHLYFDENDEMVEKEEEDSDKDAKEKKATSTDLDVSSLKKKLRQV